MMFIIIGFCFLGLTAIVYLMKHCYPDWYTGGWPHQESFFNIRYMWVNAEFTPRETMRGKMALMGYLYGIRK